MATAGTTPLARFTDWLTSYGDAWEAGDTEAAGSLFAARATLQPSPFAELVRGRDAIGEYFSEQFARWRSASFSAQVLGVGDTYAVAHWRVASEASAMDGIFVVALDERGRCTSLRQWWHDSTSAVFTPTVH